MSQDMRPIIVLNAQERYAGAFACELLQRLSDVQVVLLGPRLAPLEALRAVLKFSHRARCWTRECDIDSTLATRTAVLWLQATLGDVVQLVLQVKPDEPTLDCATKCTQHALCAEMCSGNFWQEASKIFTTTTRYWQVDAQTLATQARRECLVAAIERL